MAKGDGVPLWFGQPSGVALCKHVVCTTLPFWSACLGLVQAVISVATYMQVMTVYLICILYEHAGDTALNSKHFQRSPAGLCLRSLPFALCETWAVAQ